VSVGSDRLSPEILDAECPWSISRELHPKKNLFLLFCDADLAEVHIRPGRRGALEDGCQHRDLDGDCVRCLHHPRMEPSRDRAALCRWQRVDVHASSPRLGQMHCMDHATGSFAPTSILKPVWTLQNASVWMKSSLCRDRNRNRRTRIRW
jgi:hypothetical protein